MNAPTLFSLSAQQVTNCKNVHVNAENMPQNVVESLTLHMSAASLVDFIDSQKGIQEIYQSFSLDGFQKFYLHLHKVLEKRLLPATHKKLNKEKSKFSRYINNYSAKQHSAIRFYYFLVFSLGLLNEYVDKLNLPLGIQFFFSKFGYYIFSDLPFPVPKLIPKWNDILPQDVDTRALFYTENFFFSKKKLLVDNDEEQHFFTLIIRMSNSFVNFRNHEVLAYGFELLSLEPIHVKAETRNYYLYIYGMLAVVLARIHTELSICLGFLEKAKLMASICSQKLDILFYQQQIFYFYNVYNRETLAFEKIFKSVPMKSEFYKQTFVLHFESTIYKTENYLCQALCLKTFGTRDDLPFLSSVIRQTLSILKEEKRFVYKCLATDQLHETEFEKNLIFLEIYIVCVERVGRCTVFYSLREKLRCFALQLTNHSHFLKCFLNHITQPHFYNVHYFDREMDICHKILKGKSRMVETEQWGNVCFTLFLMFEILGKQNALAIDWLENAEKNYKINNSPRLPVCLHYKNKDIKFTTVSHETTPQTVDISKLLKENIKIATLIKLGIISIDYTQKTEFL
jgi:hypothetical protein